MYQSIIHGFTVPLRSEHKEFFTNVLIPLHKSRQYPQFHQQLIPCCLILIVKDQTLGPQLIQSMLNYWPYGSSDKEKLFLSEVMSIVEVVQHKQLKKLIKPLCKRIMSCVGGPNVNVADKALCLFECEKFVSAIKLYRAETYPIIAPVIENCSRTYWNEQLLDSFRMLKNILREIDP